MKASNVRHSAGHFRVELRNGHRFVYRAVCCQSYIGLCRLRSLAGRAGRAGGGGGGGGGGGRGGGGGGDGELLVMTYEGVLSEGASQEIMTSYVIIKESFLLGRLLSVQGCLYWSGLIHNVRAFLFISVNKRYCLG